MPYTVKQQKKQHSNCKNNGKKNIQSRGNKTVGTNINLTSKLTAVLSGHGKTKAYLHLFNLREDAKCVFNKGHQTMDHILFQCVETRKQRDLIKLHLRTQKKWPVNKSELITKHRKVFSEHIESIELDTLQQKSDK